MKYQQKEKKDDQSGPMYRKYTLALFESSFIHSFQKYLSIHMLSSHFPTTTQTNIQKFIHLLLLVVKEQTNKGGVFKGV